MLIGITWHILENIIRLHTVLVSTVFIGRIEGYQRWKDWKDLKIFHFSKPIKLYNTLKTFAKFNDNKIWTQERNELLSNL